MARYLNDPPLIYCKSFTTTTYSLFKNRRFILGCNNLAEMLQNLLYFWNTNKFISKNFFFVFNFVLPYFSPNECPGQMLTYAKSN